MKIVSGSANHDLAEKVAQKLGMQLTPLEIFIFPDGERRVQVKENVVEEDCIIVQPTNPPVDTNYIELFFIVDALKRSGAREITVVIPYMGYQRQDHVFRDGEAVSLEVCIKTLESLGLIRVITCDLHSIKIPEFFHVPLTHLSALPLFADLIRSHVGLENVVLVTPDMGGIRRIKILSDLLGNLPYMTIVKNRDLNTGSVEAAGISEPDSIYNHAEKYRQALIVDDMISSGKTIVNAANLLHERDIEHIATLVTHPIFSAEAPDLLQASLVEKVVVTDSVYVPKDKHFSKLEIISLADMIAEAIQKAVIRA